MNGCIRYVAISMVNSCVLGSSRSVLARKFMPVWLNGIFCWKITEGLCIYGETASMRYCRTVSLLLFLSNVDNGNLHI